MLRTASGRRCSAATCAGVTGIFAATSIQCITRALLYTAARSRRDKGAAGGGEARSQAHTPSRLYYTRRMAVCLGGGGPS
jgi:hypothetical protein